MKSEKTSQKYLWGKAMSKVNELVKLCVSEVKIDMEDLLDELIKVRDEETDGDFWDALEVIERKYKLSKEQVDELKDMYDSRD